MKSNNDSDNDDLINYYNFNEDGSCISIGTKIGFKILTCNPFTNFHYTKFGRGIGIIELYHSSNIIALTGSEKNSQFPINELIVWDDNKGEIIKEMRISSKIRIIKIIKNILFIVNDLNIFILNFENLSLINSYELYSNKSELISFSVNKTKKIAYTNKNKKKIFIEDIDSKKQLKIKNDNDLEYIYLQFNSKGDIIAGAMDGKICLYKTSKGELIREINNNILQNKNINCINFSENDKLLAISTIENNSGNINIFDIGTEKESSFFDYFISTEDKFFAYYNFNCKGFKFKFFKNDCILIVTSNGEFIKININQKDGGKCQKIEHKKIFN